MAFEPTKLRAKGTDVEYFVNSPAELNNRLMAGDTVVVAEDVKVVSSVLRVEEIPAQAPAYDDDKPKPVRPARITK